MATPTSLPATFVAGNVLTAAQMNDLRGAFRIMQVASTAKTDGFSTTSTSFTDVTGVSVSITPSSATSKILVRCFGVASHSLSNQNVSFNFVRDATAIGQSTGASVQNATGVRDFGGQYGFFSMEFLDSPATTSATTYKLQIRTGSGTAYIGGVGSPISFGAITVITVMEVSA